MPGKPTTYADKAKEFPEWDPEFIRSFFEPKCEREEIAGENYRRHAREFFEKRKELKRARNNSEMLPVRGGKPHNGDSKSSPETGKSGNITKKNVTTANSGGKA